MSTKQLSIAALAIVLAGILGAVAFLQPDAPKGGSSLESAAKAVRGAPATPGMAPERPGDELAKVQPIPESIGSTERRTADGELTYAPTEGHWLVGQVLFPDGVTRGEQLEVFALSTEMDYSTFVGLTEGNTAQAGSPGDKFLLSKGPVDDRGSFRLAVEPRSTTYLMLRGRYLYLPKAVRVSAESAEPIALKPVGGACMALVLEPPAGSSLGAGKLMFRTSARDEMPNPMAMVGSQGIRLSVDADLSEGVFELRAIPVDAAYDLTILPETWAAQMALVENFKAFATQDVKLALTRGGRISGLVVDESGTPIADATIQAALPGATFGFDDRLVRSTESSADGTFTLTGVCALPVTLRAEHARLLDSKKVRVETGEGEALNGITLTLESGKSLTGRVVRGNGDPAGHVEVVARFDPAFLAGPSAFNALRGARRETITDADGNFVATGLGGGPFVLECEADGPADTKLRARQDNVPAGSKGLTLVLQPPMGLWGRVVDGNGLPLDAFRVRATRQVESAVGNMGIDVRETVVDDGQDGAFFIEDMVEGSWHVSAIAPAHRSLLPAEVDLPSNTETEPLVVTVTRTTTIAGRVLDPSGKPFAGATIEVDSGQPNWVAMMSNELEAPQATSAGDGTFVLESAPPGALALYAKASGFARGPSVTTDVAPGAKLEDVTLHLARGGRLTGEVYTNDGELAAGMLIMANSVTMNQNMTTTDSAGFFEIEGLEAGSYQVIAMDRTADMSGMSDGDMGGVMNSMKISQAEILDGEDTHIQIGAPPANPVRVHGRVTHGGAPFERAMVTFFPSGTKLYEKMKFTNVNDRGEYEIVVDGPGEYVTFIQRLGGAPGQQQNIEFSREVPEVDDFRLNFELPLGRVSGTTFGPDHKPRPGTRVTLSPAGGSRSDSLMGGQYAEIQTAADGTFDIPALRPGSYTLSAGGAPLINAGGAAGLGRVTREVDVREDQWLENVDFTLAAPGAIDARVTDPSGASVQGAYLFVRNSEGQIIEPFSMATTDGTGHFQQRGLAPGEYTVTARKGPLVSQESSAVRVTTGGTSKLEVRIEDGAILWVRIRDGDGPIRASIRIVDSTGREWGGMFGMEDLQSLYVDGGFSPTEHRVGPLPPGKYRVHAESEGLTSVKPVTLQGNEERKLTIRLK